VLHAFIPGRVARIAAVIGGGAVSYATALLLFGLAPEERRLFDRLIGRLRRPS